MTYAHSQWNALFTAFPVGAAPGVPMPQPAGARFLCEVAKITADNVDNSPAPVWVDISNYVTVLDWLTGTTAGEISRWPVEQWSVTTQDLTAVLGDFVDLTASSTSTAPAPGMFLRWGIYTTTGPTWTPVQSGIVETIEDIVDGRVRGWRFQCFGTLIYYAGLDWRPLGAPASTGRNLRTQIVDMLNGAVTGVGNLPWPWGENINAQDVTLPTLIGENINFASNMLGLIHRLADSMGQLVVNGTRGELNTLPWNLNTGGFLRFSDEPAAVVAGHAPIAGTIAGTPRFVRSQDRTGGKVYLQSQSTGTPSGVVVDAQTYAKWDERTDAPGFPKLDLVMSATVGEFTNLKNLAASLISKELRIERIDCDTVQDVLVWAAIRLMNKFSLVKFERRRPGTTWFEVDLVCVGVAGTIDFSTGVARAKLSYFTRLA